MDRSPVAYPNRCRTTSAAAALAAGLVATLPAASARAGDPRPSPHLDGDSLPESPRQAEPWTPPTSELPDVLVTAVSTLFEQGLADPRGAAYHEIEIGTGSCWTGDAGVIRTRGWVLPAAEGAEPRWAVSWNGLVYPLAAAPGEPADLAADVAAFVAADEQRRARWAREHPDSPFYRHRQAWPEGSSASHRTLLPLKTALLLRLGEAKLADAVWTAWTAGMARNTNDDSVHLEDPYLMLATDWTWARWDRAVCAHMRGDHRLALADVRRLIDQAGLVDATAEARGFDRPQDHRQGRAEGSETKVPYLGFLERCSELLREQERRVAESTDADGVGRARELLVPAGAEQLAADASERLAERFPEAKARIAALVTDLELVAARQGGQPGGVSLGGDPIVRMLVLEGEAAVEPLLECLESDPRLTRSVHFWRDFSRHRSLLGVHEAAYVALSGILETSFFGAASTGDDLTARGLEGRRAVAARVREHWERFRGVPLEERWYRTLADDAADPQQWLQAIGNIVAPADVAQMRGSMFGGGWTTVPARAPGEVSPLRGETLRAKKEPSVAGLLVSRMRSLAKQPDDGYHFQLRAVTRVAIALATWDAKLGLEELRWVSELIEEATAGDPDDRQLFLIRDAVELYERRHAAGDELALPAYAAWVRGVTPKNASHDCGRLFGPIWRHVEHPAMVETEAWLFGDEDSPWNPIFADRLFQVRDLFETSLVGLPGFRAQLLRLLADRSRAGRVKAREDGSIDLLVDDGWSGSGGSTEGDPLAPEPGVEVELRWCDLVAHHLGWIEGLPKLAPYWPEKDRDAAVAACVAHLQRFGERYRPDAAHRELLDPWSEGAARMSFPARAEPATPEDVEAGRAIFTLRGDRADAEIRAVADLSLPRRARWVGLQDHPLVSHVWDPETEKTTATLTWDEKGIIWQAEEIRQPDGSWRRFYGFVGRYSVARVPAEKIELEE